MVEPRAVTNTPGAATNAAQTPPAHPTAHPTARQEAGAIFATLIPWAISLLAHAGLILATLFIVWTVSTATDEQEEIIPIVSLSETPSVPLQVQVQQRVEQRTTARAAPSATPTPVASSVPVDVALPGLGEPLGGGPSFSVDVSDAAEFETTFMGSKSGGNARNIVFIVDASGSMLDLFNDVIEELRRTIRELSPEQRFAVIFISGQTPLEIPPTGLRPADAQRKQRMGDWLASWNTHLARLGSGDTLAAIRKALGYSPDLVFLLSDNISGSGAYAIDQQFLIEQIAQVNRNQTKINTIQFAYPDRTEIRDATTGEVLWPGTMQRIAQQTGGVYTFIAQEQLGENY